MRGVKLPCLVKEPRGDESVPRTARRMSQPAIAEARNPSGHSATPFIDGSYAMPAGGGEIASILTLVSASNWRAPSGIIARCDRET